MQVTYRLGDHEYEAVQRLPGEERYEHLVKRAADAGELWTLEDDDGWVKGEDEHGRKLVPIWPHPRYAEASAADAWERATPVPISVREWIHDVTPRLIASSQLIAIFPTSATAGDTAIDPASLAADLTAELDLLE